MLNNYKSTVHSTSASLTVSKHCYLLSTQTSHIMFACYSPALIGKNTAKCPAAGGLRREGEKEGRERGKCAESQRYTCRTATPLPSPCRLSPSPTLPSFLQFGLKIVPRHASAPDIGETLPNDFEILKEDPHTYSATHLIIITLSCWIKIKIGNY